MVSHLVVAFCLVALFAGLAQAQRQRPQQRPQQWPQTDPNLDMFSYGETDTSGRTRTYGPPDWQRVRCPDLDTCLGYPDGWETGVGWQIRSNTCRWCPHGSNRCGTHHQSPIDLKRNRAIERHRDFNECIDVHWMAYFDSTCTWSELTRQNAFTIERHALKVIQPVEHMGNDKWRIGCRDPKVGRQWGKIDFSKGFSDWWHLSHIDVHLPSEHTQQGKRYDGELQMYHFYSVSGREAGVNNELASVTVFLESYDGQEDYPMLNRLICQWRKYEEETRAACGKPSVTQDYPGCWRYTRGHNSNTAAANNEDGNTTDNTTMPVDNDSSNNSSDTSDSVSTAALTGDRKLRGEQPLPKPRPKAMSAHDIMVHNYHNSLRNETHKNKIILLDDDDFKPENDFDWDAFIEEQYRLEEEQRIISNDQHHRHLMNYDHVGPWFNYFPMIGVRTEYYYRYSGSQTIPPCYGNFIPHANRAKTNNWRIMKDPLRISKRQLNEMHRLLRERIAPADSRIRACRKDTAAKQHPEDPENKVWVARPLQSNQKSHHKVFCECEDWPSKWREDKRWCRMKDKNERFYDHPYNYRTDGF